MYPNRKNITKAHKHGVSIPGTHIRAASELEHDVAWRCHLIDQRLVEAALDSVVDLYTTQLEQCKKELK